MRPIARFIRKIRGDKILWIDRSNLTYSKEDKRRPSWVSNYWFRWFFSSTSLEAKSPVWGIGRWQNAWLSLVPVRSESYMAYSLRNSNATSMNSDNLCTVEMSLTQNNSHKYKTVRWLPGTYDKRGPRGKPRTPSKISLKMEPRGWQVKVYYDIAQVS